MRLSNYEVGTYFNRMDIFEIWALQMSHNWGKEISAVRGEEYSDVASVHGILSSTGQILLGLNYPGREKWGIIRKYLWRFILWAVQLVANVLMAQELLEYSCSPQIFTPVTIPQLMHLNMD